ncbi:hypothetical protein SCALM49S_00654 [Streptomyces californicus]
MLTFDDVMNAPVSRLRNAADDWDTMAARLEKLAEEARTGMKAKAEKARWEGVNAGVTKEFIGKTASEFHDAATQARGIASLLADACTSFTSAKRQLAVMQGEEGPAAGVVINARGKVLPRHDLRDDRTARRDPAFPEALRQQEEAVAAWQRRVDRVVEDCHDADESLKRALEANMKSEHDFTKPAYKTLDAEQAGHAAELLRNGHRRRRHGAQRRSTARTRRHHRRQPG